MSIAAEYADYCTSLSLDDVPEEVVEYAKKLVLDTVGNAVGSAGRVASSDVFLGGVRALDAGDGATVLATGEGRSPAYAALANGALAHSLDYDDTHRASSLHPGAPVIPAALAAGERADASGEELLAGIVAGYEITIRLGMAVNPTSHYDRGFHMTATCGTFGATAAAGTVLGLPAGELVNAFGLNGSQAAGSLQFLENGSWNKRAHPGLAGHAALVSIALAEEGFVGATNPIEGPRGFLRGYSDDPHPGKATAGLGEEYELANTGLKPYPCCRYMHNPLDLLLGIAEEEDVDAAEVESVVVKMAGAGVKLTGDPTNAYPRSFVDGQFSMPFGAALALARRDAGVDAFLDEIEGGVSDEVARLIDATEVTTADWIEEAFPGKWAAEVAVETTLETYTRSGEYARGEPENPLSWEEVVGKYEALAEPVLGGGAAARAREHIASLESISTADLVAPFADAAPAAASDD